MGSEPVVGASGSIGRVTAPARSQSQLGETNQEGLGTNQKGFIADWEGLKINYEILGSKWEGFKASRKDLGSSREDARINQEGLETNLKSLGVSWKGLGANWEARRRGVCRQVLSEFRGSFYSLSASYCLSVVVPYGVTVPFLLSQHVMKLIGYYHRETVTM